MTIARLTYLSKMINKYADAYFRAPSARQDAWADEYDDARGTPVWLAYCAKRNLSTSHDSNDCRA